MAIKTKLTLYALASLAYISSPTLTAQSSGMSIDLTRETLISVETYYNLPSGLLTAICQVESGCNRHQSPVREPLTKDYAYGPFQIRLPAYKDVRKFLSTTGTKTPLTRMTTLSTGLTAHIPGIKNEAMVAGLYLHLLKKRCGSWHQAISAYNTGKCLRTTRYNQKVLSHLPLPTRRHIQKELHETSI